MSRLTVVVIAVLMIAWGAATATDAAAASPVQNVQCFVGDDGAGFTSAQILRGSSVDHSGPHPAPAGCGAGSSAAPPDATASGTCAPDQQRVQRNGLGERQRVDHRERLLDGSGPRCDGPRNCARLGERAGR